MNLYAAFRHGKTIDRSGNPTSASPEELFRQDLLSERQPSISQTPEIAASKDNVGNIPEILDEIDVHEARIGISLIQPKTNVTQPEGDQ